MRRLLLMFGLLSIMVALSACRQARCAWETTRDGVCGVFERPCQPEPCGPVVLTDPVYDPVCASSCSLRSP